MTSLRLSRWVLHLRESYLFFDGGGLRTISATVMDNVVHRAKESRVAMEVHLIVMSNETEQTTMWQFQINEPRDLSACSTRC
jgi:hypothetical protein